MSERRKQRVEMEKKIESDKSFLGTEPVGKLLFRLAVPTVTAQMINMLYNVVDRIYIGHIPKTGALSLTGVGVCMPLIMIVSAFAALVGNGGAPRATILMGKGEKDQAEQILGNCFVTQILVSLVLSVMLFLFNRPISTGLWGKLQYHRVCSRVYEYLCSRYNFRTDDAGNEYVYHFPGICQDRNVVGTDRCSGKSDSGSGIYLRISDGSKGSGSGDDPVSGTVLYLGAFFPVWEKDGAADQKKTA